MARPLLNLAVMSCLVAGAAASSCVIPPNLERDEVDGGLSSSPVIVTSGPPPEFSLPGPIVLERGDERNIVLTIRDSELADHVFVRLFVNYPDDVAVRAECQGAPSGERDRIVECPTRSLCDGIDDQDTSRQFLEAMVADRAFLPDNHEDAAEQDINRALPLDASYSFRAWMIICSEAD